MARRWQVQATYAVPGGTARAALSPRAYGSGLVYGVLDRERAVVVARVRAASADEALVRVDARVRLACGVRGRPVRRLGTHVRRLRGLALRRCAGTVPFAGGWGGPGPDDGSAGVREPRRPLGDPPSDAVARDPYAA